MIFVTVGSQKFQFNRLLKHIDILIEKGEITQKVFAQIGASDYIPKNYEYEKYLNRELFIESIDKSNIVITHGGTGAIIGSIKKNKKVIAVPRLKQFDEHVDDHQLEIVDVFSKQSYIKAISEIKDLANVINQIDLFEPNKYESNTHSIISSIEEFIHL